MMRSLPFAVLVVLLGGVAAPLQGQGLGPQPARDFHSTMRTGVGYSAAVPEAMLGAGAFHFLSQRRVGFFADWKMTHSTRKGDVGFYEGLTVAEAESQYNHPRIQDEDEWLIFNGGLMYAITPELALMIGGGAAYRTQIREYYDPDQNLSASGSYFVQNEARTGWGRQLVAGLLIRAGRNMVFRFGHETGPGGMSAGAYWVLP